MPRLWHNRTAGLDEPESPSAVHTARHDGLHQIVVFDEDVAFFRRFGWRTSTPPTLPPEPRRAFEPEPKAEEESAKTPEDMTPTELRVALAEYDIVPRARTSRKRMVKALQNAIAAGG